jgi:hypothetical protein
MVARMKPNQRRIVISLSTFVESRSWAEPAPLASPVDVEMIRHFFNQKAEFFNYYDFNNLQNSLRHGDTEIGTFLY